MSQVFLLQLFEVGVLVKKEAGKIWLRIELPGFCSIGQKNPLDINHF